MFPQKDEEMKDAMEKVLRNEKILVHVFQHLDFNSSLSVRLVCRTWGNAVSSTRPTLFKFNIVKCFQENEDEDSLRFFNAQLLCHLYISDPIQGYDDDDCIVAKEEPCNEDVIERFVELCQKYGDAIETCEFEIEEKNFLPYCAILEEYCPRLTCLKVTSGAPDEEEDEYNYPKFPEGKAKPNFTHLEISYFSGDLQYPLSEIFQTWITSSPKLEHLGLYANYYPDLYCNTSLKSLKYTGFPYETESHHENYMFEMEELCRMIGQVKGTLERLELDQHFEGIAAQNKKSHSQSSLFQLPQLPLMGYLSNKSVEMYPLKTISQLPHLRGLQLASKKYPTTDTELQDETPVENCLTQIANSFTEQELSPSRLKELKILRISGIAHPRRALQDLWSIFPKLQAISVELITDDGPLPCDDVDVVWDMKIGNLLTDTFESICTLALTHLTLNLTFKYKLSQLVQAMEQDGVISGLFSGLRKLTIVNDENMCNIDDVRHLGKTPQDENQPTDMLSNLRRVLASMKPMETILLKNFLLNGSTAQSVFEQIYEQRLPLRFK